MKKSNLKYIPFLTILILIGQTLHSQIEIGNIGDKWTFGGHSYPGDTMEYEYGPREEKCYEFNFTQRKNK